MKRKEVMTRKITQIDELMATPVEVSNQPTTTIQRAAPQQAQKTVQSGQTKINIRDIAPKSERSGTGSARMSSRTSGTGFNTMKPTTTDVKRNISNRFNPSFSQQGTGSLKASSVSGSSSFSDRKSTRLNSSHTDISRMPSSA